MRFFIILSVLVVAYASPIAQDESVYRLFLGNIVSCVKSDLGLCLKEQALKATERLGSLRKLKLSDGVSILISNPKEAKSLELSNEIEERRKQVTAKLWDNAENIWKNSELEISFDAEKENEENRAIEDVEEGRGKKKAAKQKIKILLSLLLLGLAKAVAIIVGSLVVIAAALAKLAILAKIAFIAKAIAIIKALLAKKHQHHHEEEVIIPVPHHEEHGHYGHSGHGHGWDEGWSRSKNEGNSIAYSAYSP